MEKMWEKPELVILARGMPEEDVILAFCIVDPSTSNKASANIKWGQCTNSEAHCTQCSNPSIS
jgi:hypothetical protein